MTDRLRIGIDVGGTFTDLVILGRDGVRTIKVLSTSDRADAVMAAIDRSGVHTDDVDVFAHGTTVATNALLERTGARTALITTEGFRDVIEIGRQDRPSLYDLTKDRPPPLVPRELRFTVRERTRANGVAIALSDGAIDEVVTLVRDAQPEAVAVCLLFSYLHAGHERELGAALDDALPAMHVSLSSEVVPEFREYERFATTSADAYLGPRLASYLGDLAARCGDRGLPSPLVMQSSGGVTTLEDARRRAVASVLSGPAAGVIGAAHVGRRSGYAGVLSFDMGGTSTDVAAIVGGEVVTTTSGSVAGVPIKLPMVDVHTVGAGGGSIAWRDAGGALRVGPRSAGAEPGPASYGTGGGEATVTDADVVLGYMAPDARLGGAITLDASAAHRVVGALADRLGLDALETARGIAEVAEAEMVRALRVVTIERGLDPRDFALVAFGGAGPMHACALAEQLEIGTLLVPKTSGVLSALGLATCDLRHDLVRPFLGALDSVDAGDLEQAFSGMTRDVDDEMEIARRADLRYRGQAFEVTVDAGDVSALAERFHDAYRGRYGYDMRDEPVEVVALRVITSVPADVPSTTEAPRDALPTGSRAVYFDDWVEAAVYAGDTLGAGSKIEGPAIVDLADATCVVHPGWSGAVDDAGALVLERP